MKYTKAEMLEMADKHSPEMFKLVALDCLEWLSGQYYCVVNGSYIEVNYIVYGCSDEDLSEAIRAAIKEVCK